MDKKQGKKKRTKKELIYVEPTRKSVYEVLLDNMHLLQRNMFVHRIIYIGNHTFPIEGNDNIGRCFKRNVGHINNLYCEEYLTGFLLHYSKYFIHVLDGSEESIRKHLDRLFASDKTKNHLVNVRLLAVYHNINQRFINGWAEISAKPPQLIQKINPELEAEEAKNKIAFCISKLYKFGYLLRANEDEPHIDVEEMTDRKRMRSSYFEVADDIYSSSRRSVVLPHISAMAMGGSTGALVSCVPEVQLMEFLLDTPYTLDLQTYYMNLYGRIPSMMEYAEKCWPVLTDYIPRNIFDDEYDPVVDIADPDRVSETDQVNNIQ